MPGLASSLAVMLGYAPLPGSVGASTASAAPTVVGSIEQRLAAAPTPRRTLKTSDELGADFSFTSDEGPYEIQDKIVLGSDIKKCTLHFGPGADVRGGTIPSGKTFHVDIAGTADNPVILRHITFDQDLGGGFKAQYAIFDDCTFHKTGAWYANGGFSSKWEFSNCVTPTDVVAFVINTTGDAPEPFAVLLLGAIAVNPIRPQEPTANVFS
jgi:hypothetical protein